MLQTTLITCHSGGFGLVLDGSKEAHQRADNMLNWDVSNGVARRFDLVSLFISSKSTSTQYFCVIGAGREMRMLFKLSNVPWKRIPS